MTFDHTIEAIFRRIVPNASIPTASISAAAISVWLICWAWTLPAWSHILWSSYPKSLVQASHWYNGSTTTCKFSIDVTILVSKNYIKKQDWRNKPLSLKFLMAWYNSLSPLNQFVFTTHWLFGTPSRQPWGGLSFLQLSQQQPLSQQQWFRNLWDGLGQLPPTWFGPSRKVSTRKGD